MKTVVLLMTTLLLANCKSAGSDEAKTATVPVTKTNKEIAPLPKQEVPADASSATLDREKYSVIVKSAPVLKTGDKGVVQVQVVPKTGWKINDEFPLKLTVDENEGAVFDKNPLKKADAVSFSEKEFTMQVGFTPKTNGKNNFSADFRFAVCTPSTCVPQREKLAWVVDVQ